MVLRIDSPGGSALASDLILREMELLAAEKPVVVSMSDLAASGGYYIAAKADQHRRRARHHHRLDRRHHGPLRHPGFEEDSSA